MRIVTSDFDRQQFFIIHCKVEVQKRHYKQAFVSSATSYITILTNQEGKLIWTETLFDWRKKDKRTRSNETTSWSNSVTSPNTFFSNIVTAYAYNKSGIRMLLSYT